MSDETPSRPPRRILVALDASPHSQAALDLAARLAAQFEANLEGLFIEDERLIRAARLPFSAEVRTHSRPPKELNDRRVQRQLRYQSDRAEAAFQQTAEDADVAYNFEVTQGNVTRELLKAAQEADLVALGKTSTDSSRQRLGSTSRTVLREASVPVLVLRNAVRSHHPLLVYYDGSEAAELALQLALQLVQDEPSLPLRVLLPARDRDDTDRLSERVQNQCADLAPRLSIHRLTDVEIQRLATLAYRAGEGLVVLPDGCAPLSNTPLQRFLSELDRPLLVVR